jgi:hypothetical protein
LQFIAFMSVAAATQHEHLSSKADVEAIIVGLK